MLFELTKHWFTSKKNELKKIQKLHLTQITFKGDSPIQLVKRIHSRVRGERGITWLPQINFQKNLLIKCNKTQNRDPMVILSKGSTPRDFGKIWATPSPGLSTVCIWANFWLRKGQSIFNFSRWSLDSCFFYCCRWSRLRPVATIFWAFKWNECRSFPSNQCRSCRSYFRRCSTLRMAAIFFRAFNSNESWFCRSYFRLC